MSILDQIKLTKMREVSKLNKIQLEYDRKNYVKSSENKQRFEDSLHRLIHRLDAVTGHVAPLILRLGSSRCRSPLGTGYWRPGVYQRVPVSRLVL